jgi:hypothetical protein
MYRNTLVARELNAHFSDIITFQLVSCQGTFNHHLSSTLMPLRITRPSKGDIPGFMLVTVGSRWAFYVVWLKVQLQTSTNGARYL